MKIKVRPPGEPSSSVPSTPATEYPPAQTPGTNGKPRIKLKSSQPPTPANEFAPPLAPLAVPLGPPTTKPKRPYVKKPKPEGDDANKKRSANDDISPAPKRATISFNAGRRNSIKQESNEDELVLPAPTPTSAGGPRISLKAKKPPGHAAERKESKLPRFSLQNRRNAAPPKRPVGVGYDSEASDAETDPLVENQFVLRMSPGDDCDYLRESIANKTLGTSVKEGGADVSIKFLDKELRRLIINIRGKNYAAVVVDLPCIIESMKSWDKRGFWKVADICQMMLVLGPTENDDTAKAYELPKEVDKKTWGYAHGLTPPMHYVRKRRFRQRASYKTVEHIDEEVERLLQLDKEADSVSYKIVDAAAAPEDEYDEANDPDDYIDTTEDQFGQAYSADADADADADEDEGDLEADLLLAMEADNDADPTHTHPPLPIADAAANLGAVETAIAQASAHAIPGTALDTSSTAPTPLAQEEEESEDESSDEDEDDDDEEDSPTAIDEDLVERERELEGQRQDIEELEKRIQQAKMDIAMQKNVLLKSRKMKTLKDLEEELAVKKRALGLGDEDDE